MKMIHPWIIAVVLLSGSNNNGRSRSIPKTCLQPSLRSALLPTFQMLHIIPRQIQISITWIKKYYSTFQAFYLFPTPLEPIKPLRIAERRPMFSEIFIIFFSLLY